MGPHFRIEGRPLELRRRTGCHLQILRGHAQSVLRGRDVTDADNLRAPGVVVINDYTARGPWPGEDAMGEQNTLTIRRKILRGSVWAWRLG